MRIEIKNISQSWSFWALTASIMYLRSMVWPCGFLEDVIPSCAFLSNKGSNYVKNQGTTGALVPRLFVQKPSPLLLSLYLEHLLGANPLSRSLSGSLEAKKLWRRLSRDGPGPGRHRQLHPFTQVLSDVILLLPFSPWNHGAAVAVIPAGLPRGRSCWLLWACETILAAACMLLKWE